MVDMGHDGDVADLVDGEVGGRVLLLKRGGGWWGERRCAAITAAKAWRCYFFAAQN